MVVKDLISRCQTPFSQMEKGSGECDWLQQRTTYIGENDIKVEGYSASLIHYIISPVNSSLLLLVNTNYQPINNLQKLPFTRKKKIVIWQHKTNEGLDLVPKMVSLCLKTIHVLQSMRLRVWLTLWENHSHTAAA